MKQADYVISIGNNSYSITLLDGEKARINGQEYSMRVIGIDHHSCTLNLNGSIYNVHIVRSATNGGSALNEMELSVNGAILRATVDDRRTLLIKSLEKALPPGDTTFAVRAPMPGLVSRTEAAMGDKVKAGDGILILEAMKMENEIRCPSDGVITELKVRVGQSVERNEILAVISTEG